MIVLLLGCGADGPQDPLPPVVPSSLDDEGYRFCHVPGADTPEAARWCELLAGAPPERCPGLRETCDKGLLVPERRGCEPPGSGSAADRLAGGPPAPKEPWRGCEDFDVASLASLTRWVAAIGVAVGILVLLRLIWATFAGRRKTAPSAVVAVEEAGESPAEALPDVPDVPSGDLLSRARAALAAGRCGEAVLLARGAALRHLGERGLVRLHRASTDREYVRAVRQDADLAGQLRVVLAATEDHRFGGRDLDPERAGDAIRAAQRVLGVAAVVLALLLGPADARAQARYRPSGDAALLELFRLHGYDAGWRLRSLSDLDEDDDILVLDLSAVAPTEEQWTHLRGWVEAGAVLIVGGDTGDAFPELGRHAPLSFPVRVGVRPPLVEAGIPGPRWPGGPSDAWFDGAGRTFVAGVGDDGADACALVEVLDLGTGVVVAIADPQLLWNASLVHPDNEAFLGELAYAGQSLEGWPIPTPAHLQLATLASAAADSSSGANNPFRSLANARLLAFVLQLLLTFALAALWRGWPFAPLRDPKDEGRIGFVEHVLAHGRRWSRLRASGYAARAMASLWLSRLGPAGLQWAAERAGYAPDAARTWVREVEGRAAGAPTAPTAAAADHAWMEELWRVTRGRSS